MVSRWKKTASNRWATSTPNSLIYAENLWICGPFPLRCPSESSNILFVSVDRPSPISTPNFNFCVLKGWGYFRGDDFLCSGKQRHHNEQVAEINAPPKKVSNCTWELQPHCSTSGCNNVWSFQTPRKRWEWQLKARTHIPKGVLLRVGEVGLLSYPQKKTWEGRKDKCSSCFKHVFNNMPFNSHLFWGNIWKIISM